VILALQAQQATIRDIAVLLEITLEQASDLLQRCYTRYIVDRVKEDGTLVYAMGSFGAFMDHFAKYENWDDLPPEGRQAIDRRFLDEFIAKHRDNVERKMLGLGAENTLPNDTVLLLSEVEEMIRAAQHIVVQPCDCRRLGQNCDRPVDTCIWLDDSALESLDRGHGRFLSADEALDLVRWADRKGLMHTADAEWRTRGLHAICNCCACDCYPFRAASELGSKGFWPQSHYLAVYITERCNLCGACVKRCHFGAFHHDGSTVKAGGQIKANVRYDPERCWGCGLCVNACPSEAIAMEPWP
jgi:ferredoxin